MTKLAELKQRLMDNPEVRKEYAEVDAEFALIEAKLTQAELAEKVGTPQAVAFGESSHKRRLSSFGCFTFTYNKRSKFNYLDRTSCEKEGSRPVTKSWSVVSWSRVTVSPVCPAC